jgi:hypothetical protein
MTTLFIIGAIALALGAIGSIVIGLIAGADPEGRGGSVIGICLLIAIACAAGFAVDVTYLIHHLRI